MASMLVVLLLVLEWPARSNDRAFRLKGLVVLLSGRKEGLHQGVRGKQTLWGHRQPCTLQSSSPARWLGPQSRISSLMKGLNPLSVMLTFSSIPPLMTGSGSGPACIKKNNRRPGGQKTRLPGWDTNHLAPSGSGKLLSARSRVFPQLTFHFTGTYSVT